MQQIILIIFGNRPAWGGFLMFVYVCRRIIEIGLTKCYNTKRGGFYRFKTVKQKGNV